MRKTILSLLMCLATMVAGGQNDDTFDTFVITPDTSKHEPMPTTLEGWARRLNTFGHYVPQEKVYVHMDNTCYFLGDTIWYAIYTRCTDRDLPSKISRVLYVELFNQDGYLVERQILEMKNGKSWGNFALPDTLYSGYYELRAYTRWQLNWGQYEHEHTYAEEELFYTMAMAKEYFRDYDKLYSRVFPVYDKPKEPGIYSHDMTLRPLRRYFKDEIPRPKFHLTLYPEGGTLVADAPCRMAFEVSNEQGETATGRCVVLDSKRQPVAEAEAVNRGRGLLQFTPKSGETYQAVFYSDSINSKGDTVIVKAKLNNIPTEGISTMLNLTGEALMLEVNARGAMSHTQFGYTITHEGILEEFGRLEGRHSTITIPRSALRPGVNQMTLFDAEGRIYADRLFFVSSPNLTRPTVKVSGLKEEYEPYEKIALTIQALPPPSLLGRGQNVSSPKLRNESGNVIAPSLTGRAGGESSISLSIRDAALSDPLYDNASIQVEMLLSSEIKGFVPNPGWYFERDDEEHRLALDLLMLTQGWRRFDWREMATPRVFMLTHPAEYSQVLEGSVHRYSGYSREDYFETEQMVNRDIEMMRAEHLSNSEISERLSNTYGEEMTLRVLGKTRQQERWDDTPEHNQYRAMDPWRYPNSRRAQLPFGPAPNGGITFSSNRNDFASQQVYEAGATTPQTRHRNDRPSWQRLMTSSTRWKHEPIIHAEFTKPGCKPLVCDSVTTNGRFHLPLPDIDGYCTMWVGAANSRKRKHRRQPAWTEQHSDNPYRVNDNDYPDYYVRLSFPYPRFVKPYSWYQCHLAPLPEQTQQRFSTDDFVMEGRLREVVVRSRHGGLRGFDINHPVLVLDAYEAFNATIDAGFNFGSFGLGFAFDVAHTYISDMNMHRHYDIEERRDGFNNSYIMPQYIYNQYFLLSRLDKVSIYTDYAPREEGSRRYRQDDQPSVTVNLQLMPDNTSRTHYVHRFFAIQGFNYPDDFYHADYSRRRPTPDEVRDYRRTLYWNPDLQLDRNGEATVTLYNNARHTIIEATVAGQTEDGTMLFNETN